MKQFYIFLLAAVVVPTGLCSCVYDEEQVSPPQGLVVDGYIESGGYPVVRVGRALSPDRLGGASPNDYVVKWAKVTVSDGEKTVTLMGVIGGEGFPPHTYTSYDMVGTPGRTYTLTVEYRGQSVQALTTIPEPVSIRNLQAEPVPGDTTYVLRAEFTDPPEATNYYTWFTRVWGKDDDFLLSHMGVMSDKQLTRPARVPVYRGKSLFTEMSRDHIYFDSGSWVQVKLRTVDAQAYAFWNSFSNQQNFSSNMFFPYTENLQSNVQGGLGCWCGYGVSSYMVQIP